MNANDLTKKQSNKLVAERPYAVGDAVHYAFNGDYYPATVIEVSASGHQVRVQSESGVPQLFTRRANGAYRSKGYYGTWCLGKGTRDERNPSF